MRHETYPTPAGSGTQESSLHLKWWPSLLGFWLGLRHGGRPGSCWDHATHHHCPRLFHSPWSSILSRSARDSLSFCYIRGGIWTSTRRRFGSYCKPYSLKKRKKLWSWLLEKCSFIDQAGAADITALVTAHVEINGALNAARAQRYLMAH